MSNVVRCTGCDVRRHQTLADLAGQPSRLVFFQVAANLGSGVVPPRWADIEEAMGPPQGPILVNGGGVSESPQCPILEGVGPPRGAIVRRGWRAARVDMQGNRATAGADPSIQSFR